MRDRMPTLKIRVSITENDDTLETLYTDEDWTDVREVLRKHLSVYDTEAELDEANDDACSEENDRG